MALSHELNTLLTQVGPGTPGGDLLRRYWMPICPAAELKSTPKKRVKLLGESLVLFRDGQGRMGLIPEQCPHRKASLYFGFLEEDGLRCPYHGWKFNAAGECIEMPFEPKETKLKALACAPPYQVRQLAGLIFAYIGPLPAPELPRWEYLVRNDGTRSIVVLPIHHNNWVQAQENSHDPVHTYYLHAQMMIEKQQQAVAAAAISYFLRPIEAYDFKLCHEPTWSGIRKIREYGGDRPELEHGHPAVFPNILIAPQGREITMHWRVPVDDTHTYIVWCEFTPSADGAIVDQSDDDIPVTYLPHPLCPDGEYDLTTFPNQDLMAWETQGPLADRSDEILGASDKGITMFRKLLREQIEVVRAGKDPVGTNRDPALNDVIRFDVERTQAKLTDELSPHRLTAGQESALVRSRSD